jgi:hypothetical protein
VGAGVADRLLEVHLAAVQLHAAGLLDGVDDVLRGDRAEQAAVVTRGLRDRQDGARQQRRVVLRPLRELAGGALLRLHAALRVLDRRRRRGLRQLAREQEVAQVPLGDVDDVAALADVLHVLEEDRLGHPATCRPRRAGGLARGRA